MELEDAAEIGASISFGSGLLASVSSAVAIFVVMSRLESKARRGDSEFEAEMKAGRCG